LSRDLVVGLIIVIMVVVGVLVGNIFFHQLQTRFATSPGINNTMVGNAIGGGSQTAAGLSDFVAAMAIIGVAVGIIISGFFLDTHPVFMVVYVMFGLAGVVAAVFFGDAWASMWSSVSSFAAAMPMTNFLMGILPLLWTVVFGAGAVIMFGKGSQVSGR